MRRSRPAPRPFPAFSLAAAVPRAPLHAAPCSGLVCPAAPSSPSAPPTPLRPCMATAHHSPREEGRYGAVSTTAQLDPPSADLSQRPRANDAPSQQGPSQQAPPPPDPPKGPEMRLLIAGGALLLVLAGASFALARGVLSQDGLYALAAWFETLGPTAVYLYAGLYFVLELIGVPAIPLTLGSGYLFGVPLGTVAVSISSTLAAAAAFLIARYGLRDSVSQIAARYPKFRAMDRAIGRQGFKFVFLLRLSPLLPFAISNYLYGLTSVHLVPYVLGSWLGMLPGTIAYVSAGAAVQALADLSAGKSDINPVLVVIGLVATVAALSTIGKMATEAIEADEEEVVQN